MKRLFLIPLCLILLACNSGCSTTKVDPTTGATVQLTGIEQAQNAATTSVLVLGQAVLSAKPMLQKARAAGYLTKEQFNNSVDIYNQALASYTLLNKALQAAISAGQDPSTVAGYTVALAKFATDKQVLDNITVALGVK